MAERVGCVVVLVFSILDETVEASKRGGYLAFAEKVRVVTCQHFVIKTRLLFIRDARNKCLCA